jgi:GMP synthase (glutamine-hydrolysing)
MIVVIVMDTNVKICRNIKNNFRNCIENVKFINYNDNNIIEKILDIHPNGIILSGSTHRILDKTDVIIPSKIYSLNIPILGICYGYQTLIKHYVGKKGLRSYVDIMECKVNFTLQKPFNIINSWYKLSHYDDVIKLPKDWISIKESGYGIEKLHHINEIIGGYNDKEKLMGIIFHPEKNKKTGKKFFEQWQKWILS